MARPPSRRKRRPATAPLLHRRLTAKRPPQPQRPHRGRAGARSRRRSVRRTRERRRPRTPEDSRPPAVGRSRPPAAGPSGAGAPGRSGRRAVARSSRATAVRPTPAIVRSGRCRGRPSRPRVSRFGGRVPPGVAPGFFRTLRHRRSAARRAGPGAADSGRAIGRAGAARADPAAIAARARAAHVKAARVRVARAQVVPPATGAGEPALAAATVAPPPADRVPRRVPPRAATGATGRVPRVELAEARAEGAADGVGGSSSIPRRRDGTAPVRRSSPSPRAAGAGAGAGPSGSSPISRPRRRRSSRPSSRRSRRCRSGPAPPSRRSRSRCS
jgi:hypothetical protein